MNKGKVIKEIITDIDKFINDNSISKSQKASFVMGATMFRDETHPDYYEDVIKVEPEIGILAEMASDLEVTSETNDLFDDYYKQMLGQIEKIREKYKL